MMIWLPQIYTSNGSIYKSYVVVGFSYGVAGIKCPVCSKFVMPDDIECHLVMCLTKPRLSYNGKFGDNFDSVRPS